MSLWKIAWRNIAQRALSSGLTGLSMALGVALVVAVLVAFGVVARSFSGAAEGYNIIVGAKGGKLQLVLNTVYHLSTPIENIPWNYYTEFINTKEKQGRFASQIVVAIPYCLGDNFEGYRVVGTTRELFTRLGYKMDSTGQPVPYGFSEGRNFKSSGYFEGVVGSVVARRTGLKVGDKFHPTHGVTTGEEGHKHDPFKVVGVLAPTGTPNDRAMFVNIEGFFLLEGHAKEHEGESHAEEKKSEDEDGDEDEKKPHDHGSHKHDHDGHDHAGHHHHEPLPPEQREVTAILIRTTPLGGIGLPRTVNKEAFAQAVTPVSEVSKLFDAIVKPVEYLLLGLAVLIVIVAGIGIMVSIYNSMSDRQRDIAIMRALGASRNTVMWVVLQESILLSLAGGLGGLILGHGLIWLLNPFLVDLTGVSIGFLQYATFRVPLMGRPYDIAWELVLVPGLVLLAALVGFLPALTAYRTDVSKALSAAP